jgi:hypothetical protein
MASSDQLKAQADIVKQRKQQEFIKDLRFAKGMSEVLSNPSLVDMHRESAQKITKVMQKYGYQFPPSTDKDFLKEHMKEFTALLDQFEETKDQRSFKNGMQDWTHRTAKELANEKREISSSNLQQDMLELQKQRFDFEKSMWKAQQQQQRSLPNQARQNATNILTSRGELTTDDNIQWVMDQNAKKEG